MKSFMYVAMMLILSIQVKAMPGPRPGPPPGAGGNYGGVQVLNDVTNNGVPFLALSAPDDAISRGEPGNRSQVDRDVHTRAQQICTYFRHGQLVDFSLGYVDAGNYVTFEYGFRIAYVSNDLVRPFNGSYAQGFAQGFSSIRCR